MNEKMNMQRRRLMQIAGIGFAAAAAHPTLIAMESEAKAISPR